MFAYLGGSLPGTEMEKTVKKIWQRVKVAPPLELMTRLQIAIID
jgi:hypothetical protein